MLGVLPPAPDFAVTGLDGKPTVKLADYAGKVLVLVFFLPTCPHCHQMLKYLDALAKQLDNKDLAIVPISIDDKKYVIEEMVSDLKISLVPYIDRGDKAQKAYNFQLGVPEVFVIDRQGRIVKRTEGDDLEGKIETLLGMTIKRELGVENPILLRKAAYTGEETCSVCHREQHATWELTAHASAWQTLVEHGADRDPECLKCHTVGFGKPGFDVRKRQPSRGVQARTATARRPAPVARLREGRLRTDLPPCHDPQHSPQFSFAERLPLVPHAQARSRPRCRAQGAARQARQREQALHRATTSAQGLRAAREGGRSGRTLPRARSPPRRRARRRTPTASAATPPASRSDRLPRGARSRSGLRAATVRASAVDDPAHGGHDPRLTDKATPARSDLRCHDDANDPLRVQDRAEAGRSAHFRRSRRRQ